MLLFTVFPASEIAEMLLFSVVAASGNSEMLQRTVFPASESAELLFLYNICSLSGDAAIFSSSRMNVLFFRSLELANGQNCCISERLQPPLRLQEAFEAFSK